MTSMAKSPAATIRVLRMVKFLIGMIEGAAF
jgi:hypothetical protein